MKHLALTIRCSHFALSGPEALLACVLLELKAWICATRGAGGRKFAENDHIVDRG